MRRCMDTTASAPTLKRKAPRKNFRGALTHNLKPLWTKGNKATCPTTPGVTPRFVPIDPQHIGLKINK